MRKGSSDNRRGTAEPERPQRIRAAVTWHPHTLSIERLTARGASIREFYLEEAIPVVSAVPRPVNFEVAISDGSSARRRSWSVADQPLPQVADLRREFVDYIAELGEFRTDLHLVDNDGKAAVRTVETVGVLSQPIENFGCLMAAASTRQLDRKARERHGGTP